MARGRLNTGRKETVAHLIVRVEGAVLVVGVLRQGCGVEGSMSAGS